MRYLTALLLSFTLFGCGMSPKDMINDCTAEYLPLGSVTQAGYIGDLVLRDKCRDKIEVCWAECYLAQKEASLLCNRAHDEAITACEAHRQSLIKRKE
jgi:hypothetical protein